MRLLRRVLNEEEKVAALCFIGDQCEEEAGELRELAGLLGAKGIPIFVFHECQRFNEECMKAKPVFQRMAAASGGLYTEFSPESGGVLGELLSTVAAFSAAGAEGLKQVGQPLTVEARQLQGNLFLLSGSVKPAGRFDVLRPDGKGGQA